MIQVNLEKRGKKMKKVDATQGNLSKQIFIYAIPLILSTILQTLFDVTDKAVLGNMANDTAVASIGATSTVTALIINGAVGLSTGTAIVLARVVGQKNKERIRSTIDTSLITSLCLGLIVAVCGLIFSPDFLNLTDCPQGECYDGALIYMRIVIAAAPATLLYNYGSAILRTLGDSRSPLFYITAAGVINVVMNVILCLILPQKVIAVAIATISSKIISAILVFRKLCTLDDTARVVIHKMRFHFHSFLSIIRFGIPVSISTLVLPLGNLQIQTAINSYGTPAIAGHSAAISLESFSYAIQNGFSGAAMTFMGQNIGAKNVDRVRKTFRLCLIYNVLISGLFGYLSYLTGRFWLGIIVGMKAKEAIDFGMIRLSYVLQVVFINAIGNTLINAMKAFGYPMLTSITNVVINLGFRVIWMQYVYPLCVQFSTIMQCYTVAWLLNLFFYIIFFSIVYRRYVKTGKCKEI